MRKIISLMLAVVMVLSLAACGSNKTTDTSSLTPTSWLGRPALSKQKKR